MRTLLLLTSVIITMNFSSCKEKGCTNPDATNYNESAKKDDGSCVFSSNPPQLNIDSPPMFEVVIDGTLYKMEYEPNNEISYFGYTEHINLPITHHKSGGHFEDNNSDDIYLGIYHHMSTASSGVNYPNPLFYDTSDFTLGQQVFYQDGSTTLDNQFEINFYLENTFYSSRSGDQSNGTLEIEAIKNDTYNGYNVVKVLFNVNCTVYSLNNPAHFKNITDGKAVILFDRQ